MTENLSFLLRTLVSVACPLALLFVMSGFKCRRKTVWAAYALIVAAGTAVCAALLFTAGQERMRQVYFLVLLAPSLVFLLVTTSDRPSQLLFNFFTAVNAFYLTSILSHFALGAEDEPVWADALIRMAIFALILFLFLHYLRQPYRFIAAHMKKDWRVIALLPFLFFALVMFLGLYPHTRSDNLMAVVFLYLILCVVYYVIYQVFRNTYSLLKEQGDNDALRTQVGALRSQMEAVRRGEEQVRIYRHDIRHYAADAAQLIKTGNTEEALRVLGALEENAKSTRPARYCQNDTVNAILSLYLQRATEAGVVVEAKCDLPDDLPVDAVELAMVFANAIENAVHACERLPPEAEKKITVRCVSAPQLALEVANTYAAKSPSKAEPLFEEPGEHGLGSRSIAAFAEKYGALLDYEADEKIFRLRLLMQSGA